MNNKILVAIILLLLAISVYNNIDLANNFEKIQDKQQEVRTAQIELVFVEMQKAQEDYKTLQIEVMEYKNEVEELKGMVLGLTQSIDEVMGFVVENVERDSRIIKMIR